MEAIPFRGFDATDDGIRGVLGRDGFTKGDGYKEACFRAFFVDGRVDGASFVPGIGVLCDILEEC